MLDLHSITSALVAPGKGVLAADEGSPTIDRRFAMFNIPCTEETRRSYREALLTAPGIEKFISGVILFDETVCQSLSDGTLFPAALAAKGVVCGVGVDRGLVPLAGASDETTTEGLDGLRERLQEYHNLGVRFSKWRAAYVVGRGTPSGYGVRVNAHALARFARLSQECGLVPIVEPDVVMEGAHNLQVSKDATARVLEAVFRELKDQGVDLGAMLLKPNMVLAGFGAERRATPGEVGEATLEVFYRHVPAAVAGIVFLSGGQGDEEATANLNAMNLLGPHPWPLSFSYSRALQRPALEVWRGRPENVEAAQLSFLHRARMNGAAARGAYMPSMEPDGATPALADEGARAG